MYVKLIDPKAHGKTAYENKGSCQQAVYYLVHEARKEKGRTDIFFDQEWDHLGPEQVQAAIDQNIKGLKSHQEKFFSLILSPSENELRHIHNSAASLKEYTRAVMELYAAHFKLKEGNQLASKDLIWFATIHQDREYRGTDQEVLAGKAQVGQKRPGLQTHLHVMVSAKDREQQFTLNPGGRRSRFNLMNWQMAAGQQFEQQFQYTALEKEKLKPRQRDKSRDKGRIRRIGERVQALNLLLPREAQLDVERVQQLAAKREFDKTYYRSLKHLEALAVKGVPLPQPYYLLQTGKVKPVPKAPRLQARHLLHAVQQALHDRKEQVSYTEEIGERRGRRKGEIEIE